MSFYLIHNIFIFILELEILIKRDLIENICKIIRFVVTPCHIMIQKIIF